MRIGDNPNTFANNPLDRASDDRVKSEWLEARMSDEGSRFVPLWRQQPLLLAGAEPGTSEIGWLRPDHVSALSGPNPTIILLGLDPQGVACFAVDISHYQSDPTEEGPLAGIGRFADLRGATAELSGDNAAILAQAKALVHWHQTHGHCAVCGARTDLVDAGYRRHCTECAADHFPRTDPVVIMLAVRGENCLVGRNKTFPPNMYSALAGFLEPGETIEEAVAREVLEEASIRVSEVRYHSSQPWPYPASLMIGCIALADNEDIEVDGNELVEARWIDRDTLREALHDPGQASIGVPPKMAIAHQLMKAWVDGEA